MRKMIKKSVYLLVAFALPVWGCEDTMSDQPTPAVRTSALENSSVELTAADEIAEFLKDNVAGLSAQQMDTMMSEHYKRLRLLDASGQWRLAGLAAIGDYLLPGDIDESASFQLIDDAAAAAQKNPYLADFLAKARQETFADYMAYVDEEGDEIFPDVIAYAHVLERLTSAMRDDWRVLEACMDHWKKEREIAGISEHLDWFEHAKLASVEWPMGKFVGAHKDGYVPSDFMKGILPINIMEAVAVDASERMLDNAFAGTVLAKYTPGARKNNEETGEGPSCFSDDGKAILLKMALPKQWADLYAVWNLAFVTSYSHPYIMVKLLIPAVNDYEDEPAEYIYNRGTALYTHIHFEAFRRIDFINEGTQEVSWPDEHLREFFGELNRGYAKDYDRAVKEVKYPWLSRWF